MLQNVFLSGVLYPRTICGHGIFRNMSDQIRSAQSYQSWDTRTPVKIRLNEDKSQIDGRTPISVQTMFKTKVEQFWSKNAMGIKRNGIEWNRWTYEQYYLETRAAAKGFLALGLERFAGVGIMGANTPEWFMSSVGAILAGGLSTGIYATNSGSMVSYISHHAPLNLLVIQDAQLLNSVIEGRNVREVFPTLKAIVFVDGRGEIDGIDCFSWQQLIELGQNQSDRLLVGSENCQAVNDCAMLIYTSGTTGPPKGAMLSHDNITWTCHLCMEHYGWNRDGSEQLMSYLPLSHVAAQLIDCYMAMSIGANVLFADKNALKGTLVENLKEIRPTQFLGVPRVYEKIAEKMQETAAKNSFVKKTVANWAKSTATEHHTAVREGRLHPDQCGWKYKVAKKVIFGRIHEALGLDRARNIYCSAAPLSDSTFRYFQSLDIVLQVLLGSTETSGPQTTNLPGKGLRIGSVGQSYNGVLNTVINPDPVTGVGEIVTKSRNVFMGYQKDEAKTKAAFTDDGWLKSGDLGLFDEDQFLFLKGRLKELIITAGGENIAPVPIEEAIKTELSDVVSYAIVVGEKKKYLSCVITLKVGTDAETMQPTRLLDPSVVSWAEKMGCQGLETLDDFISGPHAEKLRNAIQIGLDAVNSGAGSNPQRIQKFAILPNEFSVLGGELGPTLKIKRYSVYEKYASYIENMYSST